MWRANCCFLIGHDRQTDNVANGASPSYSTGHHTTSPNSTGTAHTVYRKKNNIKVLFVIAKRLQVVSVKLIIVVHA